MHTRHLLYGKDVKVVAKVAVGGLRLPKVKVKQNEETWIQRKIFDASHSGHWRWIFRCNEVSQVRSTCQEG